MFANFKCKVLKVDLRKGGKKAILVETEARLSGSDLEALNDMIGTEVLVNFDPQVISYRVRKNAKTDKPIVTYKVDDSGVVEEVKAEGQQLELDMGLPAEKVQVKEELAEISRGVVDEFIEAGLAPRFPDLKHDLPDIIRRHADGESYNRLAAEINVSSNVLAELLEDYYKQLAPLAAKWDEWRQEQDKPKKAEESAEGDQASAETDNEEGDGAEPFEDDPDGVEPEHDEEYGDGDDEFPEFDDTDADKGGEEGDPAAEASPVDLDEYILSRKPQYDDIPYDFPALLARRNAGETWREIAASLSVGYKEFADVWRLYKGLVEKERQGGAA